MVKTLIYAYLAICIAMIIFNIVCIYIFHRRDKKIQFRNKKFTEEIIKQMDLPAPTEAHMKMLRKKLVKVNYLMAFDEALDKFFKKEPERVKNYIENLSSVFVYLTLEYIDKDKLQAAYFPYIIKKYGVLKRQSISIITDAMLELVKNKNLYCRENALQALYTIGNTGSIIDALEIIDRNQFYHHTKMLADGLLTFSGVREDLDKKIWENFFSFSIPMRLTLLDYFRFSSDKHCEPILRLMVDPKEDKEIRFRCIRYFAKYKYEPALPFLYDFTEHEQLFWEYTSISAFALASYPSVRTIDILKQLLTSPYWYVRYNAAKSLEKLGLRYEELIDVFEGDDRYASEILRYRFDRRKLIESEDDCYE